MIPETYKTQSACVNCRHVFTFGEFDCGDVLYCHQDGSDRPICGSVLMDEDFTRDDKEYPGREEPFENFCIGVERWQAWSRGREVAANGICDQHEEVSDD